MGRAPGRGPGKHGRAHPSVTVGNPLSWMLPIRSKSPRLKRLQDWLGGRESLSRFSKAPI